MKALIKAAAFAAFLLPSMACAQQMLTLKANPVSGDGKVTVGDVFDNAGPMAGVLLGYRNGANAFLDAATVQSVVGANGGYWANPRGQRRIIVTAGNAATANAAPIATRVQRVAQPADPFASQPFPIAPAMTASGATGPNATATPAIAVAPAQPVHNAFIVHRSDVIDVTWSAGGLALTMSGIVQRDAAVGDTVAVQNPTSKKMIDALITGPGHAVAGPGADQYRATLQLSSR
jgi:flagella basal body P-ring formation protein FlgA